MIDREKVREVVDKIYDEPAQRYRIELLKEWLEQNQPEVVVGLSDYQIRELAIELEFETTDNCERDEFEVIIKNWLKTQTFAQPCESLIADNLTLAKELEQLKSQQLKPDWSTAPTRADEASIAINWHKDGVLLESKELFSEQRPQPAPTVEIGQVWKNLKNKENYTVKSLGKMKIGDEWVESVTYWLSVCEINPIEFTRTLSDFLAKFEQLGGE